MDKHKFLIVWEKVQYMGKEFSFTNEGRSERIKAGSEMFVMASEKLKEKSLMQE